MTEKQCETLVNIYFYEKVDYVKISFLHLFKFQSEAYASNSRQTRAAKERAGGDGSIWTTTAGDPGCEARWRTIEKAAGRDKDSNHGVGERHCREPAPHELQGLPRCANWIIVGALRKAKIQSQLARGTRRRNINRFISITRKWINSK